MWGELRSGLVASMPNVGGAEALEHGSIVIAAITSCTNTSNPSVMLAAGLLAKRAVRTRAESQALGEDLARARFTGRDRLLRTSRAHALSRSARFQPRRLRLHHLHRQFRAASAGDLRGDQTAGSSSRRGAVRQPQLRGPHPFGSARQLSDVAAARRGLRACRTDHDRSGSEPLGHDPRRAPVFLRDLWPSKEEIAADDA